VKTADTAILDRVEAPVSARSWPAWLKFVPLAVIMAVQLALTVRLIRQGYASNDEGRYIDAGHALIYELLHGGGSPYFETYFSGAPVVYSPLAAMADYVGGLAAVRLMSAVFMQTATMMLYLTGKRLFGYWPAIIACALYAGLGPVQYVGRNAIYDALALMLLSMAAYCATRSGEAKWLLLVPVALLAADAAKYIVLLFNPTVVFMAAHQARGGLNAVVKRTLVLGGTTAALLVLAVFLAGTSYLQGMMFTTIARKSGYNALLSATVTPDRVIVSEAWSWFGLIIALAFAAAVVAWLIPGERRKAGLLLALSITTILVTLEAIHLKTDQSTGRHDAFAAWFGCLAAGYVLALLARSGPWHPIRWLAVTAIAGLVGFSGALYTDGSSAFHNHGSTALDSEEVTSLPRLNAILQPYLTSNHLRYLLSGNYDYSIIYNDHVDPPWWNLWDDVYMKYPIPGRGGNWHGTTRGLTCTTLLPRCQYLEGDNGFIAAIRAHDFAVISVTRFEFSQDFAIRNAAEHTPGYVLLTTSGGGPTWIYLPDYEHPSTNRA
jgi:Dolichyl-phosphate-mannose-protein mannosyltransferase